MLALMVSALVQPSVVDLSVQSAPIPLIEEIIIEGNTVFAEIELQPEIASFLGQPITLEPTFRMFR